MKPVMRDVSVVVVNALVIATASFLLYRDFTGRVHLGKKSRIGTITFRRKVAERKYSGQVIWENVSPNTAVYNYDSIRTAKDSAAIIKLKDGTVIKLNEDTLIMLSRSGKEMDIDFGRGSMAANRTGAGGASQGKLNIKTGGTSVSLDKADVSLRKTGQKEVNLNVRSGNATVKTADGTKAVKKDEQAVITDKKADVRKASLRLVSPAANAYLLSTTGTAAVTFAWQSDQNTRVRCEVARSASFGDMVFAAIRTGNATTRRLPPGSYYWRVRAAGNATGSSSIGHFTVMQDRPVSLIAPGNGANFRFRGSRPLVRFSWRKSEHASSYVVEISRSAGMGSLVRRLPSMTGSIATDGLAAGTYYWRVRNIYGFNTGNQVLSGVRRFSIEQKDELTPPRLIHPGNGSRVSMLQLKNSKLTFNWERDPDYGSYRIDIYRGGQRIVRRTTRANFYQLSYDLKPGNYQWQVQGLADNGKSRKTSLRYSLNVTRAQRLQPRSPRSGESFEQNQSINLSWADPNRGSLYRVELSSSASFSSLRLNRTTGNRSLAVGRLPRGTWYWRVWLLDNKRDKVVASPSSSLIVAGSLKRPNILYPPNRGTVRLGKQTTLLFRWSAVPRAERYQVELTRFGGGYQRTIFRTQTRGTAYRFANLKALDKGNYAWTVQAYSGSSLKSKKAKGFFTLRARPITEAPELISPKIIIVE